MKRILKVTSLLAIIICIALSGSVYAANINCDLAITTSKNDYSKGEEFIASVNLSNVSSEQGIIAFQATLEYDKNSLTLIEMSGKNSWETPIDGASYNKDNGKIVITRNQLTKNNEVIFDMKFKVNDNSASNVSITLKDIAFANGSEGSKSISSVSKSINVVNGTSSSGNTNQGNNNNNNTNTNNNNSNGNTNNTSNQNLYNGGNTKPDKKYDRTNITSNNGYYKQDKTNTVISTENKSEVEAGTDTNTDTSTSTVGTTTVDNTKRDENIPKTGISRFSFWLLIFTAVVVLVTLFFYARLMIFDKKNEYLR